MPFTIDSLANVKAHWSADQITGSPSDGTAVSTLPDSISGWNLTGSGTTRPVYKPTGINSLPSILFDGTDDYLQTASKSLTIANPAIAVIGLFTLKNYNTHLYLSTLSGVPGYNANTSRIYNLCYSTGNGLSGTSSGSGTCYQLSNSIIPSATKFLWTSFHGLGTNLLRINGSSVLHNNDAGAIVGASISATTLYANLGRSDLGSSALQGHISEIVLWDETVLSESLYIEGSLAAKYGITLPTTHPFYSGAPSSGPSTGSSSGSLINSQQLVRAGWIQ
jgi:hypothetical protein